MELDEFTRATLEEAVRIYLEEAYSGAESPEVVRSRLEWPERESLADLARGEMFERTPPDADPADAMRIRLRLGNRVYPHMKLGVDRIAETDDWVLVVDCHDAALLAAAPQGERNAVKALIEANSAVKGRIERRWTDAGLPTFEEYVRSHLPGRRPKGTGPA